METAQPTDILGTREVLRDVVRKLSSQALLFALAVIVVLVAVGATLGPLAIPVGVAILLVFFAALAGYLFVEERRRREHLLSADAGAAVRENDPAAGIAAISNTDSDFALELWTTAGPAGDAQARDVEIAAARQDSYRIGDDITIWFRAARDCHVTLLNLGTSGKLTMLFPNAIHRDNFVRGGELHCIPGPDYGFSYRLAGPAGTERLKAVATLEAGTLLDATSEWATGPFAVHVASAAPRDIEIVRTRAESLPRKAWAEAHWAFTVTD